MPLSDYSAREFKRMLLRGQAESFPDELYIGLAIATIASNQTGATVQEPASGYERFGPIDSSSDEWTDTSSTDHIGDNANAISFLNDSEDDWEITGTFLVSASSNGNIWLWVNYGSPRTVAPGETYLFNPGDFNCAFN